MLWGPEWGRHLTFDLQNLKRSSVVASEYFLSVVSKLFKAFMRYRANSICPEEYMKRTNERINEQDNGIALKHKPLLTLSGGEDIIKHK